MPSTTPKQKHFMAMVKAEQAGHDIKDVSKGTQAKLHKAADSMTAKQVEDFQALKRKTPRTLLEK